MEHTSTNLLLEYAPIVGGLATILAALIAVFGGSIAYRYQKNIDFKLELRKERRRVYSDFMRSLVASIRGDGDPHLTARLEAAQIGSIDVIRSLSKYNKYCDETGPGKKMRDPKVMRDLIAAVLIAMRSDVFDLDKLDTSEYADLLPIS